MTLLGVNIDHVATVRQARRESSPDPVEAALAAVVGGATGITAHLREDRRHIQDDDIRRLKDRLTVPLNLEMAASDEIARVAEEVKPAWACLVPERRQELTTEGGLDVIANEARLSAMTARLRRAGIRVSFFIAPTAEAVEASRRAGADAVEIHTGRYAREFGRGRESELTKILAAAEKAQSLGLVVNAGHGVDYENVQPLLQKFSFNELNIGFSIVSRAVFVGIGQAVREMKERMSIVCAES